VGAKVEGSGVYKKAATPSKPTRAPHRPVAVAGGTPAGGGGRGGGVRIAFVACELSRTKHGVGRQRCGGR
jgi:hypothetical protein